MTILKTYVYKNSMYIRIISAFLLFAVSYSVKAAIEAGTEAEKLKAMADRYYDEGMYPLALTYYTKGMETAESEKDKCTEMECIGNIANIYETLGDYESNLFYLLKGYKMSKNLDDSDLKNKYLINIVSAYCHLGDVGRAKYFFKIAEKATGSKNERRYKYFIMYNKARIMCAEGRYKDAVEQHFRTLRYAEQNGLDGIYALYQKGEIGNIRIKQGLYKEAIECGNECKAASAMAGNTEMLVNSYSILSKAYEGIGATDSARKYRSLYLEMSDSIFHAQGMNKAKGQLKAYESRKNDEKISLLTSRISIQTLVIILISSLFAISVMLVSMLVSKNRNLRNVQRLLIARNNDLMKSDKDNSVLMSAYGEEPATDEEGWDKADDCQEITPEQANALLGKIISLTNDTKIISNPDLSLKTIADMAGSNTKYVSFVINKTYNKNFRTFINEKRIREACKMLADQEHYGNMTIQTIYEEVGYTNAVSFIRAFKKVNGMTPAMYKKLAAKNS